MITIERYPKLGHFGWKADVFSGGREKEILFIGTRAHIQELAAEAEAEMAAPSRRSRSLAEARRRQIIARDHLQRVWPA